MITVLSKDNWEKRLESGGWEVIRRTVSMAGRVTDGRTGKSVSRALVTINSDSKSFIARTSIDGHFHFIDIPEGKYAMYVALPGSECQYDNIEVTVVTFHEVDGNIIKQKENEYKEKISTNGLEGKTIINIKLT